MNDRPHPDESMRMAQLSECEQLKIDALTAEQIVLIDQCLMEHIKPSWRKLAMVVISAMFDMKDKHGVDISYIYFYGRLLLLIRNNQLETQGNIDFMRWSEVRRRA